MPNALVLVIDRLGSGHLGPYGNTWIETPAWNQLAARSLIAETALSDTADLAALYHSYWQGRHAFSARHTQDVTPLAERLGEERVESWLVTDEPAVAQHAAAHGFRERLALPTAEEEEAEQLEQTQLARLFSTAIEVLDQARPPFLIWVHAQGMQAAWDAPYDLRCRFAEEEDPNPLRTAVPPERWLPADFDPDELLGYQQAYAGQVSLLDTCLGILLEAMWSGAAGESTALLATGARGYPLGEHRYVGRAERPLHGELLQVPWLFHCPQGEGAGWRARQFIQPPDVYPTLLEWFQVAVPNVPLWGRNALPRTLELEAFAAREQAASVDGHERAMRVPAWFLRHDATARPLLYAKPDDRWEFNEISDRCQDVAGQLSEVLQAFAAAAQADDRQALPTLGDVLREGLA
jgi:arylsulfatase A-like enzyme